MVQRACPERSRRVTPAHKGPACPSGRLAPSRLIPYLRYDKDAHAGYTHGIEQIDNGIWRVYYRNVFLGYFDEKHLRNKEQATRLETNLV
ncbi:hypothetical protein [Arenibacter sp. ARW7G5Y1]|uniref:hypothetical protein n=1 Tax=Arenibacter sp. ARW7G5Y1 TaxID=2135619 RepID=UPI000D769027|nr:hypothetical protein [Arenibacter sp. ARW7G5Y1]PXX30610.1 hypothetical protein C7972_102235 [Arenibacter sp. ARW7G5Y1]